MIKVSKRRAAIAMSVIVAVLWPGSARADQVRDTQWHLQFLRITEAVRLAQGEEITVAVVDSGVDATHVDLADAVLPGREAAGSGDGRVDVDGHGTGMAGLIAARGRTGSAGALGVAPRSKIFPVRAGGHGNPLAAEAVDLAVESGAQVICLAFAGGGGSRLEESIRRAIDADIVVVAGAGNRPDVGVQAPARYPGVVAAVGVDRTGAHAEISVSGPEAVLAAPAVDIVSTNAGGGYRIGTGTSDATAIIAGVAALVRSKFPELSAPEVIHRMTATAIDKGAPGRDDEYGFGIVDPVAALTANVPPLASTGPSVRPTQDVAQPPSDDEGDNSVLIGLLVGALLISAAAVGGVIAFRYANR